MMTELTPSKFDSPVTWFKRSVLVSRHDLSHEKAGTRVLFRTLSLAKFYTNSN